MPAKPTILYVIDDLGRGGAETLLVGLLPSLGKHYNIVLVSLSSLCEFQEEELPCSARYSLSIQSKWSYPTSVLALRRIIKKHQPDVIHAHLLNSSIIARFAAPPHIPFVQTLHSILSNTAFNNSWIYRNLEKMLFKKRHRVIAVSQEVLDDYESKIGKPHDKQVLWNYVEDKFFDESLGWQKNQLQNPLRLVAVGNIKKVKNYEYLVEAFSKNPAIKAELDIYGKQGELGARSIEMTIQSLDLPIKLRGQTDHVEKLLLNYDCFVMPSKHEGFGIAAVEAMAIGLPLLLSDIKVLRDISFGNAIFFDLSDPGSFLKIVEDINNGDYPMADLSSKGKEIAKQHYSKNNHLSQLFLVYDAMISKVKK